MASLGIHKWLYKDLFPSLGLGGAEARSAYRHKLTLGLKGLGLGRTLYLWGVILESRVWVITSESAPHSYLFRDAFF
jgi:hypothetical protein